MSGTVQHTRCRLCDIILDAAADDAEVGLCLNRQARPEAAAVMRAKALLAHRVTDELRTVIAATTSYLADSELTAMTAAVTAAPAEKPTRTREARRIWRRRAPSSERLSPPRPSASAVEKLRWISRSLRPSARCSQAS